MMPFIDGRLLALGPWIIPAFVALLSALAIGAGLLIENGIAKRNWWQVALGCLIAACPIAAALAAAGVIS